MIEEQYKRFWRKCSDEGRYRLDKMTSSPLFLRAEVVDETQILLHYQHEKCIVDINGQIIWWMTYDLFS